MLDLDATAAEEDLEVQAFELLGGIIGREVRNAIVCSTELNSTSRHGKQCSHEGLSVLNGDTGDFDETPYPPDKLCSPVDPESVFSEECQNRRNGKGSIRAKHGVHRGPPLENAIFVHTTAKYLKCIHGEIGLFYFEIYF